MKTRISVPAELEFAAELNSYFEDIWSFAESCPVSEFESLQRCLTQIGNIARNFPSAPARLYKDFAPHSFGWTAGHLVGGCIYHGAHDGGGDGGAPTFSLCVDNAKGWRLHT